MYYQSNWPEVGLPVALAEQRLVTPTTHPNDEQNWVQETQVSGATFRWAAAQDGFESTLYGLPIWNLYFVADDAGGDVLTAQLDSDTLREHVQETVHQLVDIPPWDTAYVSSKVVENEPLHGALLQVGFEQVEYRRLYMCQVRDITSRSSPPSVENIQFTSLATIAPEQLPSFREQIPDICREAFEGKGHSRHFVDPILLKRLRGIDYILAAMRLNFKHVLPEHFLIAVDADSNQACGFSIIGRKPGLQKNKYTQLLSAVRQAYRGQGIYRGLTHLLSQTLPQDATLLNVTHVGNRAIQRAYQDSGRAHLSDTVVLRRVFRGPGR